MAASAAPRGAKKVLLIETWHDEPYRHHRAEYFPFLLGYVRARGWRGGWRSLRVPRESMHVGRRYVVDLPDEAARDLARDLAAWRPDVVVFHDRPAPRLARRVLRAAPGARLVDLTRVPASALRVLEGLGPAGGPPGPEGEAEIGFAVTVAGVRRLLGDAGPCRAGDDRLLVDAVQPCFPRRRAGAAADAAERPVRLVLEDYCPYQRPLRRNPFYRGLRSALVQRHRGCAFCTRRHQARPLLSTPPVEHALRQIAAHQKAGREPRCAYLLEDSPLSARLGEFLAEALSRRLKPSTFFVMPRVDTLLALRPTLERLLPRLQAAGHALRTLSVGAENFSDRENLRLNKGLTAAQLWAGQELLRDLSARFPGAFASADAECGYASILFTPWTRPEDLRRNISAARRLGPMWLQRAMGSRLQLWEGLPITELARRDGLLAAGPGDAAELSAICLSNPNRRELAWRFADPRTRLLLRLLIRLEPVPFQASLPQGDPLLAQVRRLRAGLPGELGRDYVGLAAALVAAAAALGPRAGAAAVFARAGRRRARPERA